jgi:hypothetical protein
MVDTGKNPGGSFLCRAQWLHAMRAARGVLLLGALAVPALVRAQFQEPTLDELKMTADSLAPGAPAVYLYREETTDDQQHATTYYCRIKVLSEKGKELATVQTPYWHGVDTVTDIEGRTIHADGKVVPLTAKPSDLMDVKSKTIQVNTVVFTLPDADVGSILEYRLKIRYPEYRVSEPEWDVQLPYFVHKAHFSFHTHIVNGVQGSNGENLDQLMVSWELPDGGKVDQDPKKGMYSLDLTNIPPLPDEDWMPPLNTLKFRVQFYFTRARSAEAFWTDTTRAWATDVEETIKTTNGLKKIAAELVAPGDTDIVKARKIYEALQKLDNTRFSRVKSHAERKKEKLKEIRTLEDVWKQQSGTDDEIALLYVALARAAGLKAWPAKVVDRNRAVFNQRYYSMGQLDDFVAKVTVDGKDIFVDPGQKMCPFEMLSWRHSLASGFQVTDGEAVRVTTPALSYKSTSLFRVADLTIEPTGEVKGIARFVMSGQDALHWRQASLENDQDEVKKEFNESIRGEFPDGVQADFDHFLALDDYNVNLIAFVKMEGTVATATGKHFFLPGLFFESQAKHPFVAQEKRLTPVDVRYAKMEQDEVTYHLPEGYTIESLPQKTDTLWGGHAELKITPQSTANTVQVVRTLVYGFVLLGPKDYPDLHDFYQKVALADQQQIVLSRAVVAAKVN